MKSKNYSNFSLSNLYFMLLKDNFNNKEVLSEIKKRLYKNKDIYENLLKSENSVLEQRGKNINNYLISNDIDKQTFFEIYFNYIFNDSKVLLLDEILLLNNYKYNIFFYKVLKLEIKNIKKRINSNNEDIKRLEFIKNVLENEIKNKKNWSNCNLNIKLYETIKTNFLYNDENIEKIENLSKKVKTEDKNAIMKHFFLTVLIESKFINSLVIKKLVSKNNKKLKLQKKKILNDSKNIDYSFIDNN